MDIVLEIDKYCVRVGVVGEVTPVVVPVKYEWVGEVQYLEDHALTKEQAQAVVLEMDKGYLQNTASPWGRGWTWRMCCIACCKGLCMVHFQSCQSTPDGALLLIIGIRKN